MGVGGQDETAFAFSGDWRDFAKIALPNTLLTFATLGFYRFWATTRERRYLWSRTRFIDDSFEWTGTGLELFFGFLIALLLFSVPFLVLNLLIQGLILQGQGTLVGILSAAIYIFLLWLTGVALFRGLRYRLSRTYWHGIHGGCDANGAHYGLSYLWKNVVAYLCLALLFPWSMTALWKERWEAMSFGPHRFSSNPQWSDLMGRYLIAYLAPFLIIIGLVILAIPIIGGAMAAGGEPNPAMAAGIGIAFVLAFYILWPLAALVYYAAYMREVVGTMEVAGLEFEFTARTKGWIMLFLGNLGLWLIAGAIAAIPIAAFGLFEGFSDLTPEQSPFMSHPATFISIVVALAIPFGLVGPFVRYRNWSFFVRHLEAGGEVSLSDLTQSTTRELKQGEGLLDAFDMGAM